MSEPSKLKMLAWRFFCWLAPNWLIRKCQYCMFRRFAERHPDELERMVRESLAHNLARLKSEDERSAYIKWATEVILHPHARNLRFSQWKLTH